MSSGITSKVARTDRRTARIAGALLIIATVASLSSMAFLGSVAVGSSDEAVEGEGI